MKKKLLLMVILVMSLTLIGCTSNDDIKNKKEEEKAAPAEEQDADVIVSGDDLTFVGSDGETLTFYYDGEVLTKITLVMELDDEETAAIVEQTYNSENYNNMYSSSRVGKVVTINYGETLLMGYQSIPRSEMITHMQSEGYTIKE